MGRKCSGADEDGDSLFFNAELTAGVVSSIVKDFDLKRLGALSVEEDLAQSLLGVAFVRPRVWYWQVATHLKSFAKRVKLNEGHVKAAHAYKARVAPLTSEQAKVRDWVQIMTEEAMKLRSDLRHTTTARARTEGREGEARDGLRAAEGELREVRDELQAAQDDLLEARDRMQAAQTELQIVKDDLQLSQNEMRATREELRAARDELRNKTALLDGARCEASEVVSSIECLIEECHGLRGGLQRQETLVVQRDGAIASLRDEAYTQWASGWLAF